MKKVKSILELSYALEMDSDCKVIKGKRKRDFDWEDKFSEYHIDGKIISKVVLNLDNTISSTKKYFYDSEGKIIKTISDFGPARKKYTTEYIYSGHLLNSEITKSESNGGWIEDESQEFWFEPVIERTKRYHYVRDKVAGHEIVPDGIHAHYEYDSEGEKSEWLSTPWGSGFRKYDGAGNLIIEKNTHTNGASESIYEYNERGDVIKFMLKEYYERWDDDREVFVETLRSYLVRTYKYNYDQFGNWIERIQLTDNEFEYKVEREIHYY